MIIRMKINFKNIQYHIIIINTVRKYFLENISSIININKELGECISFNDFRFLANFHVEFC